MNNDWEAVADLFGYKTEEEMYRDLYIVQGLSLNMMAEKLCTNKYTLRLRMEALEIPRRSRGGANNKSNKKVLLHLLDQRFVHSMPVNEVAKLVDAHPSTIWKYVRGE